MAADGSGDDTTCPSCGEPVGLRATFCMHCGRDLPDRVEYDDVGEAEEGSESLLTRLRPGATADASEATGTSHAVERGSDGVSWGTPEADDADADRGPGVPSGRGTDGPTFLPLAAGLDRSGAAVRFLGGLAVAGAVGVAGLDRPVSTVAVGVAVLAWAWSTVSVARTRAAFDAMRYATYGTMVTLVCLSFALAFGGRGVVPVALALVPVAVATLFVAGFGVDVAEYDPT